MFNHKTKKTQHHQQKGVNKILSIVTYTQSSLDAILDHSLKGKMQWRLRILLSKQ